jgi:hypothetical protein
MNDYEVKITFMHALYAAGKTEFTVQITEQKGPFKQVKGSYTFEIDKIFDDLTDATRYEVTQFIKEHESILGLA